MFVSRCDPNKSTRNSGFKYNSTLEKNKLFVKGIKSLKHQRVYHALFIYAKLLEPYFIFLFLFRKIFLHLILSMFLQEFQLGQQRRSLKRYLRFTEL